LLQDSYIKPSPKPPQPKPLDQADTAPTTQTTTKRYLRVGVVLEDELLQEQKRALVRDVLAHLRAARPHVEVGVGARAVEAHVRLDHVLDDKALLQDRTVHDLIWFVLVLVLVVGGLVFRVLFLRGWLVGFGMQKAPPALRGPTTQL
jgi:hypothetical protein